MKSIINKALVPGVPLFITAMIVCIFVYIAVDAQVKQKNVDSKIESNTSQDGYIISEQTNSLRIDNIISGQTITLPNSNLKVIMSSLAYWSKGRILTITYIPVKDFYPITLSVYAFFYKSYGGDPNIQGHFIIDGSRFKVDIRDNNKVFIDYVPSIRK